MNFIKMNPDKIRSYIDLKTNWNTKEETNCYAFALGLDIDESRICRDAYQPGTIAYKYHLLNLNMLHELPVHERFIYDMEALGIEITQVSRDKKIELREDYLDWKIAVLYYYSAFTDTFFYHNYFHFIRESMDGTWYHKYGYDDRPVDNYDLNGKVITDPSEADFSYWIPFRYYKLSMKKR